MSPSGTTTHTSPNSTWRITTRKLPILKADPIEALSKDIGIPIPEMIFGDNFAQITHVPTGWTLNFNVRDALDRVSKTEEGMLQVAVAEEWKKERSHQEEVRQVVKPFDWSYTTDYRGSTTGGKEGEGWRESNGKEDPIRTDLLSRQDPILFFDEVDLMEGRSRCILYRTQRHADILFFCPKDELADNGIALLSLKVRMMPARLLLLQRYFLRLDGVIVRIRDTRVYIEHDSNKVIRQYTAKEEKYEVLAEELKRRRENVAESFRDVNMLSAMCKTVEERTDVFEV